MSDRSTSSTITPAQRRPDVTAYAASPPPPEQCAHPSGEQEHQQVERPKPLPLTRQQHRHDEHKKHPRPDPAACSWGIAGKRRRSATGAVAGTPFRESSLTTPGSTA